VILALPCLFSEQATVRIIQGFVPGIGMFGSGKMEDTSVVFIDEFLTVAHFSVPTTFEHLDFSVDVALGLPSILEQHHSAVAFPAHAVTDRPVTDVFLNDPRWMILTHAGPQGQQQRAIAQREATKATLSLLDDDPLHFNFLRLSMIP
jgi:hypothetical protein